MTTIPKTATSKKFAPTYTIQLKTVWNRWAIYIFALLFIILGSILWLNKHDAFQTRTYDFARFAQAIWNVWHGDPLFTSISKNNILGNHFSPILALYAPLLLIWPDERILLIAQVVVMAVAGLILAKIVQDKHPTLTPLFLLAFYLNPYVHEVTLFEFRRIVPATLFISLAVLAIYKKKYTLMVFALLMVLLAKEDMGLVVSGFGVYLLLFERKWKLAIPLIIGGIGWTLIASFWVIPAIGRPGNEEKLYPQLFYFDYLGNNYEEIAATLLSDPLILFRQAFQLDHVAALGRFLLPVGLVLPFLSPGILITILPVLGYLLLSNDPDMYLLEKWYTAPILPIVFGAIAIGLSRIAPPWANRATAFLLICTGIGYFISSPAPGGGRYIPELFTVTEHDKVALALVAEVPEDAIVATQVRILPHLAFREHIYHYPWITQMQLEDMEYFVFDRTSFSHPYNPEEINAIITDTVADPDFVVHVEGDGVYLVEQNGEPLPSFPVKETAEGTIRLNRYDLAVKEEDGLYRPTSASPLVLHPGDEIRVNLYWEAMAAPHAERTISTRVSLPNGMLIAQHDGWPVNNLKPTSWWQAGWQLRDSVYLTIDAKAAPGTASLDVLLYDSYSQDIVPFANNQEVLQLHPIIIE